jgi:hypothetical protein
MNGTISCQCSPGRGRREAMTDAGRAFTAEIARALFTTDANVQKRV